MIFTICIVYTTVQGYRSTADIFAHIILETYRIRQCISRTRILSRTCIFRRIPKIGDKYWGKALIACLRRIPKIDC